MHTFARRLHSDQHSSEGDQTTQQTKGLVLDQGWRYDLTVTLADLLLFRGQRRAMQWRTIALANLRPGERALDVGCGTGTLALAVQRRVGASGYVAGIDPAARQIASARAKAARRRLPIDFRIGVIERLPFDDGSFDVAFSTLMMHHLPAPLKRQGLAEIARTLKPDGRLVIADFARKQDRQGRATRFHAGGSDMAALAALVAEAGFSQIEIEELRPRRFSSFPGASILTARKG
ncbi:MAG TPA: methyltransferase domain-containing protein [Ktedonobacterales bacterium]|jgi:ubiquinone/menaquinone biosynthesis C-methylase UbiE|nr:methyltransferase domain-containing protein [Ktedonobacterales bacterium]